MLDVDEDTAKNLAVEVRNTEINAFGSCQAAVATSGSSGGWVDESRYEMWVEIHLDISLLGWRRSLLGWRALLVGWTNSPGRLQTPVWLTKMSF